MSASAKNTTKRESKKVAQTPANTKSFGKKTAGNYETHPFFVTKANKMKKLIDKVGLPEGWA